MKNILLVLIVSSMFVTLCYSQDTYFVVQTSINSTCLSLDCIISTVYQRVDHCDGGKVYSCDSSVAMGAVTTYSDYDCQGEVTNVAKYPLGRTGNLLVMCSPEVYTSSDSIDMLYYNSTTADCSAAPYYAVYISTGVCNKGVINTCNEKTIIITKYENLDCTGVIASTSSRSLTPKCSTFSGGSFQIMSEEERGEVVLVGEFYISESDTKVLSAKFVGLAVDDRLLLENASFTLMRGHRYGLIGENGTGKTTLLQAIRAQIEQEDSSFVVRYVGQTDAEGSADIKESVLDYCAQSDAKRSALRREMDELESQDASSSDMEAICERIGEIMLELEEPDDSKERAEALLKKLGFLKSMRDGSVSALSGGWRARLEMALALFAEPEILFLDEPTNHLDLHAVFQLASILRNNHQNMTVIVVSHDASFLDLVSTDILSINGCMLQQMAGNYSAFEEKAAEYKRFHEHIYENRVREEARQNASTAQQKVSAKKSGNDKAMKAAASRERKTSKRVGLYREDGKKFKLNSVKTLSEEAIRLPSKAAPLKRQPVTKITLPQSHKLSGGARGTIVELRTVTLRYPNATKDLLAKVDLSISAGDRIALVGKNGAGKSTLLRALSGNPLPANVTVGEIRKPGKIAVVDQNQLALLDGHLDKSSVTFLRDRHPGYFETGDETGIRKHLGQFGLMGDTPLLPILALSGGLRVRLVLADLFADSVPPDCLLLDEPTNHLDGETIAALTAALKTFTGAVLAISHNCAFLLEVCKDLWICEGGAITIKRQVDGCTFLDNFRVYAEKIVPATEKDALQDMLRIRAARATIVVQQAGASTSLLV
ncbi:ABC transporter family [Heterostelium album PN500]|uniref:ABC transporter family n=1 Tax=Heterostelium pallidum (strain ATCC 26659 / Pp 5 / PN500) TaxID=670386 RepID=D3AVJ6_HETP5|nr:ABC transporter family [Heterostelium album PN500]EFA86319.1 ABC transporter family [Heterostelium album PN500]|eukprot:XP_020438424.1 ABC transporter family [Heterostelium album PN500]